MKVTNVDNGAVTRLHEVLQNAADSSPNSDRVTYITTHKDSQDTNFLAELFWLRYGHFVSSHYETVDDSVLKLYLKINQISILSPWAEGAHPAPPPPRIDQTMFMKLYPFCIKFGP